MKTGFGGVSGAFLSQVAPRSPRVVPGSSDYQPFGDLLGEKGGPKDRFWDPPKTENCLNSDLLPLDWHLGPPKMLSGGGSGKVSKNERKFD